MDGLTELVETLCSSGGNEHFIEWICEWDM